MGLPVATVEEALVALDEGGVIVLPTETVYGLAARADNPDAVARIFELKGRPRERALQLLVPDGYSLETICQPSAEARRLAASFWPGPLTIVMRAADEAPTAVTSAGTIGVRVPDHPIALELLSRSGPLAATSANRTGEPTPADLESIHALFGDAVAAYLDGGRIDGVASTVVDFSGSTRKLRREGAVPIADLERALGSRFERE